MRVAAVVPVRRQSTRVPEKALVDIDGLPMFVHTCKRVELAESVDRVYLATDDVGIADMATTYGISTIMTATSHRNSSERAAEASTSIECDIIVNVQGDEPLLYPTHVDALVTPMLQNPQLQVTIGVTRFRKRNSPGDIKAVIGKSNEVLYSSRNDIPCFYGQDSQEMWKLCFIVPFRKYVLQQYLVWEPGPLELAEDNHFLRLTENGISMTAIEIDGAKISVDTEDDLLVVRKLMDEDEVKLRYLGPLGT